MNNDNDMKIYKKIKKEQWDKIKKDFIKDFGSLPLGVFLMVSSIALSTMITSLIYFTSDLSKMTLIFGDATIIVVSALTGSTFTIIIFMFAILFLEWYDKSMKVQP